MKSGLRMVSINPNDGNWEEKVIEAIRYSENSIRWYCDDTKNRQNQAQRISEWWKNLNNKIVIKYHTESIKHTGIAGWKPDQLNQPVRFKISEPTLEIFIFSMETA